MSATVKLNSALFQRVKKYAKAGGYSFPEEFVEHVLEKELAALEESKSDESITKKLKGLGYLK